MWRKVSSTQPAVICRKQRHSCVLMQMELPVGQSPRMGLRSAGILLQRVDSIQMCFAMRWVCMAQLQPCGDGEPFICHITLTGRQASALPGKPTLCSVLGVWQYLPGWLCDQTLQRASFHLAVVTPLWICKGLIPCCKHQRFTAPPFYIWFP